MKEATQSCLDVNHKWFRLLLIRRMYVDRSSDNFSIVVFFD